MCVHWSARFHVISRDRGSRLFHTFFHANSRAPRSTRSHTHARATTVRVRPAVRAEPRDPPRVFRSSPGRSRGYGARVGRRAGRPGRRCARRLPNQSVPAWKRRGQRRGGHARARRGDDARRGDGRETRRRCQVRTGTGLCSRVATRPVPGSAPRALLLSFYAFNAAFFFPARAFRRGRARAERVGAGRRGTRRALTVHGRARDDRERPPPAFPAFRVDVRSLDAGSSKDRANLRRLFASILRFSLLTGPSAIAGRYFHRDFFSFTAIGRPAFATDVFFRPRSAPDRASFVPSLHVPFRHNSQNRACAWTARTSRTCPATNAGAAK